MTSKHGPPIASFPDKIQQNVQKTYFTSSITVTHGHSPFAE